MKYPDDSDITKSDIAKYVQQVVKLAAENARSGGGGPFAAVIVKNGKIIARGVNTVTATNDPTAHAEIVAIRKACDVLGSHQLDDCDLICSCEPCPMCLGAIYWSRPSRVFYAATRFDAAAGGFDDEFIYRELEVNPGSRKIPMAQVDVDGVEDVFALWNELSSKVRY